MIRVASNSTDSAQVVAIIFKIAVKLLRKSPSLSHPPGAQKNTLAIAEVFFI